MSRKQIKRIIVAGTVLIVLMCAAVTYSLLFNEGRMVYLTDLRTYQFSVRDLPMLIVGALLLVYIVCLSVFFTRLALQSPPAARTYTWRLPPALGLAGFAGFAGFLGFWTYSRDGVIFPFIFFACFGFFGFFYEGKLSHTLEDEMFAQNRQRAELAALRTGFVLLALMVFLADTGMLSHDLEWCAVFMTAGCSLICGLVAFLSQYLLYRYEKQE